MYIYQIGKMPQFWHDYRTVNWLNGFYEAIDGHPLFFRNWACLCKGAI